MNSFLSAGVIGESATSSIVMRRSAPGLHAGLWLELLKVTSGVLRDEQAHQIFFDARHMEQSYALALPRFPQRHRLYLPLGGQLVGFPTFQTKFFFDIPPTSEKTRIEVRPGHAVSLGDTAAVCLNLHDRDATCLLPDGLPTRARTKIVHLIVHALNIMRSPCNRKFCKVQKRTKI